MPTILKNHYALYMEPFTTPSTDKFVTFYETINFYIQHQYCWKISISSTMVLAGKLRCKSKKMPDWGNPTLR